MGTGDLTPERSCLWCNPLRRSLILVNLASVVEKADEVLLPAVFFEIGRAFDISPAALGSLTFARGIVQAACSPLAAYVAQHHDRTHIIAASAVWWGAATIGVALSTSFWQLALARALNGVGLAVVLPSIQSFVADAYSEEQRGSGFGWLQFTNYTGSILGGVCGTLLAGSTFLGIAGWRVAFHLMAIISFVLGFLVYTFAQDPCFPRPRKSTDTSLVGPSSFLSNIAELWASAKTVYKLPSFQVILSQGVIGSIPWSAMVFYTLWLELVGYSHMSAASLVAGFSVGNCLGGLFGGYVGDRLARISPDKGRIVCSQISTLSGIPLSAMLLYVIPRSPHLWPLHGACLFVNGFLVSWNGPATNNPIFAEIVEPRLRTAVYAFDRSLVPLSALGAPAVGIIAQAFFGYRNDERQAVVPPDEQAANARALGHAIFVVIAIPFLVCASIYSLLYFTYPKDRARAQQAQEMALLRDPSFGTIQSDPAFVVLEGNAAEADPDTEMGEMLGKQERRVSAKHVEKQRLLEGEGSKSDNLIERTNL